MAEATFRIIAMACCERASFVAVSHPYDVGIACPVHGTRWVSQRHGVTSDWRPFSNKIEPTLFPTRFVDAAIELAPEMSILNFEGGDATPVKSRFQLSFEGDGARSKVESLLHALTMDIIERQAEQR